MNRKLNRLKIVLAEKDISNKEFAKLMKTSETTVSSWVRNVAQPSLKKIYQWAKVLNVEAYEFLYPMVDMGNIEVEEDE